MPGMAMEPGKYNWRHYLIHRRRRQYGGLPAAPKVKRGGGSEVLRLMSQ